jgi:hypothetical protein
MKHKLKGLALCLAAGLCALPAPATTITSLTSGATWSGNIVSGTEADIATLPNPCPGTCSVSGFTLTAPDNRLTIMPNIGSGSSGITTDDGEIDIAAPGSGETAMILSLGVWDGNSSLLHGATLNVKLSDGEVFSSIPYGTFWFSSTNVITSLSVLATSPANEPFVHWFGSATSSFSPGNQSNPTPASEASTILLVSGGLSLFGARKRLYRTKI